MVANLRHLDTTLRLFGPELWLDSIRPKASRSAAELGRPESTTRMALEGVGEPLSAREIAAQVFGDMGVTGDTKLLRAAAERFELGADQRGLDVPKSVLMQRN